MRRRAFLGGTLATAGCSVVPRLPDERVLYSYARGVDPASRRPIITIPGILGSRLRVGKSGEFVWGGPHRLSLGTESAASLRRLALPMGDGTEPLSELRDDVRPDGVLRRANAEFLGSTVEEEIYDGLVMSLNAGGYKFSRTEEEERARSGRNPGSLEYPYDWRRDIVEAARALDAFVERKAEQVYRVRKALYGSAPDPDTMRFDFVAHSLGGLVLRYWLTYGAQDLPADGGLPERTWGGARRAACAVFVAPPNLGSAMAVTALVNGRGLGPLQPEYPPALVGSHVATYQLMSRPRHARLRLGTPDGPSLDTLYDAALWEDRNWGLFSPGQADVLAAILPEISGEKERRGIARRHVERVLKRTEQFHRAMDRPGAPPGTDMFLVVGTGLDTPATAVLSDGDLSIGAFEEGDGTVLRASALSDERQGGNEIAGPVRPIPYRTVLLLPGEHVELTHSPVFADNLLYWLLDTPRARTA